jgi:hypothetical protein
VAQLVLGRAFQSAAHPSPTCIGDCSLINALRRNKRLTPDLPAVPPYLFDPPDGEVQIPDGQVNVV